LPVFQDCKLEADKTVITTSNSPHGTKSQKENKKITSRWPLIDKSVRQQATHTHTHTHTAMSVTHCTATATGWLCTAASAHRVDYNC